MARQYVFLVHGLGLHPAEDWDKSFKDTIHAALQNYAPFKGKSANDIEDEYLRFIPISYDDIFEGFRKRTKEMTASVAGGAGVGKTLADVFQKIADSAQATQGAEKFFWESALDPLLWKGWPLVRDAVIARVNKQFADGLREMNSEKLKVGPFIGAHVIAHSLGSSVAHDALVCLRYSSVDEGLFEPHELMWDSVSMVANVSRLLECMVPPSKTTSAASPDVYTNVAPADAFEVYSSCLRPDSPNSTCRKYLNFRHDGDPFTWPLSFSPPDWTDYTDVTTSRFAELKTVHDFELYFSDPAVHVQVLRKIFGTNKLCTPAEVDDAVATFNASHPDHATDEFNKLHSLFGYDFNKSLSLTELATFILRVYQELNKP